jgi:uroporphyrinogen decarboxylase
MIRDRIAIKNFPAPDRLSPLQRMAAYNQGQPVDRLPCVPIVGNTAARVAGVRVGEFTGNGKLIAKAQIASYRKFGYDIIRVFTDLYTQAEAMGAKVHYPADETAYLAEPAIENIREISRLRPANPQYDGNLPHHLEAMQIAVNTVGNEVSVTGAVTGPLTNASFLIGAEEIARLMLKEPGAVHQLCAISLETSLRYANAIMDLGCIPSLTDAMSSGTVISPTQFRTFSLPYLRRLIDLIHSRGKKATLHICGKTHKIWDDMVEAGADCISIDNDADLSAARERVGTRVRLMGNVRPAEVMLQGTPETVEAAVVECVRKAYDNPSGYIVASGCSLPTETPFANIQAMMDAVRKIGYPVTFRDDGVKASE